jgi:6-phosphogluconolactonase
MKNLKYGSLLALLLIAFTASLRGEFLYVSYGGGLLSFSINPNTGALTKLPGTPTLFPTGAGPLALARWGQLLYMSVGGGVFQGTVYKHIVGYRIEREGDLKPLPGSPYHVPGGYLAVDPFNRFLYAAIRSYSPSTFSAIAVYRIERNGSLKPVPGSPFAVGTDPSQIAVDPFGRFIYVVNFSSRDTAVYQVQENGALTPVPGSPFRPNSQTDPISLAADPCGRYLYVTNENGDTVVSYGVAASGAITELPGSPTPIAGVWYENTAIDPFGRYVYVDHGTNGLDAFSVGPTGVLTRIQGIGFGSDIDNNPVGVCVSLDGRFVFEGNANGIVDPGPMTLRVFNIGPGGFLTLASGPYFPLGNNGVGEHNPAVEETEGYPSSMVVAPQDSEKDDD